MRLLLITGGNWIFPVPYAELLILREIYPLLGYIASYPDNIIVINLTARFGQLQEKHKVHTKDTKVMFYQNEREKFVTLRKK